MLNCWNCGQDLTAEPLPLSRHASCEGCGEYLHCCRFCTQYDQNRPGACDNDSAEPPNDKTTANFCEYFIPNPAAYRGAKTANHSAKAKLDSLFGDDPSDTDTGSGNPLDDLFDN